MKRYQRASDKLANKSAIIAVLHKLGDRLELREFSDEKLIKFAHSIHNFIRYSPKTLKSGHKRRFERTLLFQANHILTEIPSLRTNKCVSTLRYLARYLPVLRFPDDVLTALESEQITLEEAHLLNRLSSRNLKAIMLVLNESAVNYSINMCVIN